ncbi:MAG: SRPBCC family protein [Myxococcota bacterium]
MFKLVGLLALPLVSACAAPAAVGYAPGTSPEQRDALHRSTPPPPVAETGELIATTAVATLDVTLDDVEAWFLAAKIEDVLRGTKKIPAVEATTPLSGGWGGDDDRRRVELEDDSTALEQILEAEFPTRFRYVVWNYTSKVAKYVDYGVGEFQFERAGSQTKVTWTYAFKPKKPAFAGPLRRFVDGEYHRFMDESLANMQAHATTWRAANEED